MNDNIKELWGSLTDEQRETLKNWSGDDLLKFAGENGIEIPDELLDSVAGGYVFDPNHENFWDTPRWEVIDDWTGEVLKSGLYEEDAKKAAKELGQSTDEIQWKTLNEIRDYARIRAFWTEVLQKWDESLKP